MIRAVEDSYSIDFFNYSEILLLPSNFKDAKDLHNATGNCFIN